MEKRYQQNARMFEPSTIVTFSRLDRHRREDFSTAVQAALVNGIAIQSIVEDGVGQYRADEYSVVVDSMPPATTTESLVALLLVDLNATVNDDMFDLMCAFSRTGGGTPKVGDIYDIDILGPDNGSVMLTEIGTEHFIFTTIKGGGLGEHPESGSREFGFEGDGAGKRFYTRGLSRAQNHLSSLAGEEPQRKTWKSLTRGIANRIIQSGGLIRSGSELENTRMYTEKPDF